MKQSKACPKCGSADILRVADDKSLETGNVMKLGFLEYVQIPRYVCCKCGYVEEWVDKNDLFRLREKLEKQRKES